MHGLCIFNISLLFLRFYTRKLLLYYCFQQYHVTDSIHVLHCNYTIQMLHQSTAE